MRSATKPHRRSASLAACIAGMGLVMGLGRAHAGGPSLGPDEDELRQAKKFAAMLRRADGIPRALRVLCHAPQATDLRHAPQSTDLRHDVASLVLVDRAAGAMPKLLDAIAAAETAEAQLARLHDDAAPEMAPEVSTCSEEARKIVFKAMCRGDERYLGLSELDEPGHYLTEDDIAVAAAATQRALIGFLAKPGPRRRAALAVLNDMQSSDECDGYTGAGVVQLAAPALVKLLASKADGPDALRLFASEHLDRVPAAIPRIRPYLADRSNLPWAVIALARMGEDMSQEVAPLVSLLDGPDAYMALVALQAIGPSAHTALPRLVLLAEQAAKSQCKSSDLAFEIAGPLHEPHSQLVETVVRVATRAQDAAMATRALAPLLLRCTPLIWLTAKALVSYGSTGHAVLLDYLRDGEKMVPARLAVAVTLQQGRVKLDGADLEMIRLLEAKKARPRGPRERVTQVQSSLTVPAQDPKVIAREELDFCRAEAGMPRVSMTTIADDQADSLASCLATYSCGPSRSTLGRTLNRCCSQAFGNQIPSFCRP